MFRSVSFLIPAALILLASIPAPSAEQPAGLSEEDTKQIADGLSELEETFRILRGKAPLTAEKEDLVADIDIFRKGVVWALKYETKLEAADVALIKKALVRC